MYGTLCGCDFDCDCYDPCPTVEEQVKEWRALAADNEYPIPTRCEICNWKRHVLDTEFVQVVRGWMSGQRLEVCRACLADHSLPFSFFLACWLTITCFARCSVFFNYHCLRDGLSYRLSKLKHAAHFAAAAYTQRAIAFLFRQIKRLLLDPLDEDDYLFRLDFECKGLSAAVVNRGRRHAGQLAREIRYKISELKRRIDWRLRAIWLNLRYGHILLPFFPLGLFFRIFRALFHVSKRVTSCSWHGHKWTDEDGAHLYRCLACFKRQRLFPPLVYARNCFRALRSKRRKKMLVRLFTIYMMKDERRWELAWAYSVIKRSPETFEQVCKVRAVRVLEVSDLRRLEAFAHEKGHAQIAEAIRIQLDTNG